MSPVSSGDRERISVNRSLSMAALPAPGIEFLAPKDDANPSLQTPRSPKSGLSLEAECVPPLIPSSILDLFSSFTL